MALDSKLACDMPASEEQICEVIVRCSGAFPAEEGGCLRYKTHGLWGSIMLASELSQEITNERYGFIPTRIFLFRLDKFADFQKGRENLVTICTALIRDLSGDCVLFSEDQPELLRKSRNILLQSYDDEEWMGILRTIAQGVGDPYRFGELPKL